MKRRAELASSQSITKKRKTALNQTVELAVKRELRRNTDFLYTDVSSGGGVSNAGSVISLLSSLSRGDNGLNNFHGNIINPRGLRFKYYWSTDQVHNSVRVLIFQWFDASVPALSGIVQSTATGNATISPMLVTNLDYIKVLYDKQHIIAPSAADGGTVLGSGVVSADVYIPGKRFKPIRYNSTTNAVQDGCIYVLLLSDDSVLSYPQCFYYSRLTFTDH